MKPTKKRHPLYCAFCGKDNTQVDYLIAGLPCPLGQAHICNECVAICAEILFEKLRRPKKLRQKVSTPPPP